MAYVYILESLKTGRYYIGCCVDLEARFDRHNAGQVPATRKFRPFKIVFRKEYTSFSEARNVESKLKKLKRRDYLEKIIRSGEITIRATSHCLRKIKRMRNRLQSFSK